MKKRFSSGKFNLENPDKYLGKKLPHYRSSWEFQFCRFCDRHPNILKWANESIHIPYRNPLTGKQTIYVPDFFVVYVDNNGKQHTEIIEVKPKNQTLKEHTGRSKNNQLHYIINQEKWRVARQWCKQRGINFRIITEDEIFTNNSRKRR